MLTAAVRDLHRACPGKYLTGVQTTCMELWDNNPHIANISGVQGSEIRTIDMHYPIINESNRRPYHFIHGYHKFLGEQLGCDIPVTDFRGDIYLSDQEKSWTNQVQEVFGYSGKFWIIMAGGKHDYTAKWWNPQHYQTVVNALEKRVRFVQCGESHHWHPPLRGVYNLIGKTNLRQFVRLMYHASGVVCPVTFAMHLSAAIPMSDERIRPCVVLSGGREPAHWEQYPGHQFAQTIGMLSCCKAGGCWKSRCQPVGDGDEKDKKNLCEKPFVVDDKLKIPTCMQMILPERVIQAIEQYLAYA